MAGAAAWDWDGLLWLTAVVTLVYQTGTFLLAFYLQVDKLTDISGTTNFVLVAWLTYGLGTSSDTSRNSLYVRPLVNSILVTVWGLRLGGYLLLRVLKRGHDARFDELRSNFISFAAFFLYQALWVWVVMLPITLLNACHADVPLGARDGVGWFLWGLGFLMEVAADQSKDAFMGRGSSRGRIIMEGVWAWSRHPNYFGEISLWLGLFLSCSAAFDAEANDLPGAYASVLSPLFTFLILMFGSGVNVAEERYNRRHGAEQWYIDYRTRTSPLVPLPPAVYGRLPLWVKRVCLFELPLYARGLPSSSSVSEQGPSAKLTARSPVSSSGV